MLFIKTIKLISTAIIHLLLKYILVLILAILKYNFLNYELLLGRDRLRRNTLQP